MEALIPATLGNEGMQLVLRVGDEPRPYLAGPNFPAWRSRRFSW
jgi:hypothetical protein